MSKAMRTQSSTNAFGADLHQFIDLYVISDEVLSSIDPLKIIGEKKWGRLPLEPWG